MFMCLCVYCYRSVCWRFCACFRVFVFCVLVYYVSPDMLYVYIYVFCFCLGCFCSSCCPLGDVLCVFHVLGFCFCFCLTASGSSRHASAGERQRCRRMVTRPGYFNQKPTPATTVIVLCILRCVIFIYDLFMFKSFAVCVCYYRRACCLFVCVFVCVVFLLSFAYWLVFLFSSTCYTCICYVSLFLLFLSSSCCLLGGRLLCILVCVICLRVCFNSCLCVFLLQCYMYIYICSMCLFGLCLLFVLFLLGGAFYCCC